MTPSIRHSLIGRTAGVLLNLFVAFSGAYALSVLGFLLLRSLVGESWWFVAIFNNYTHLLYLPVVALLPLCLLLRRVRVMVVLLPVLLAFLLAYGELFLPRSSAAVLPEATQIRILSSNLMGQRFDLQPLTDIIRDTGADIVALQEVSTEAAAHFAAEFAEEYPYQALHPVMWEPVPGQGILSRYEITEDEFWRIHLGHQRVQLMIDGQAVALYNAHPIHPFVGRAGLDWRAEEISEVLRRAAEESIPVILAGDFNVTDQTADYGRITARYADAYRAVGWGMGFTFPTNLSLAVIGLPLHVPPLARIDYVFHDSAFQPVEARVLPESGGSDHLPLYVVLALTH